MKAAAYIRVSTDKRSNKVRWRISGILKATSKRGDELVNIYCDKGKSATKCKTAKTCSE